MPASKSKKGSKSKGEDTGESSETSMQEAAEDIAGALQEELDPEGGPPKSFSSSDIERIVKSPADVMNGNGPTAQRPSRGDKYGGLVAEFARGQGMTPLDTTEYLEERPDSDDDDFTIGRVQSGLSKRDRIDRSVQDSPNYPSLVKQWRSKKNEDGFYDVFTDEVLPLLDQMHSLMLDLSKSLRSEEKKAPSVESRITELEGERDALYENVSSLEGRISGFLSTESKRPSKPYDLLRGLSGEANNDLKRSIRAYFTALYRNVDLAGAIEERDSLTDVKKSIERQTSKKVRDKMLAKFNEDYGERIAELDENVKLWSIWERVGIMESKEVDDLGFIDMVTDTAQTLASSLAVYRYEDRLAELGDLEIIEPAVVRVEKVLFALEQFSEDKIVDLRALLDSSDELSKEDRTSAITYAYSALGGEEEVSDEDLQKVKGSAEGVLTSWFSGDHRAEGVVYAIISNVEKILFDAWRDKVFSTYTEKFDELLHPKTGEISKIEDELRVLNNRLSPSGYKNAAKKVKDFADEVYSLKERIVEIWGSLASRADDGVVIEPGTGICGAYEKFLEAGKAASKSNDLYVEGREELIHPVWADLVNMYNLWITADELFRGSEDPTDKRNILTPEWINNVLQKSETSEYLDCRAKLFRATAPEIPLLFIEFYDNLVTYRDTNDQLYALESTLIEKVMNDPDFAKYRPNMEQYFDASEGTTFGGRAPLVDFLVGVCNEGPYPGELQGGVIND